MTDLIIRDVILECNDGKISTREDPSILVVHRISFALDDVCPVPDEILDGPKIAGMYRDTCKYRAGSYTGGQMPYTFVVLQDGTIDQCLPVRELGPHAKRWSWPGVSLAVVGDHRRRQPPEGQWFAVILFAALWHAAGLDLHGHTELDGASDDPLKRCPGKYLSMDVVRRVAAGRALEISGPEEARAALLQLGVIF